MVWLSFVWSLRWLICFWENHGKARSYHSFFGGMKTFGFGAGWQVGFWLFPPHRVHLKLWRDFWCPKAGSTWKKVVGREGFWLRCFSHALDRFPIKHWAVPAAHIFNNVASWSPCHTLSWLVRASLEVLTLQAKKELENEVVPWHIYLCFFSARRWFRWVCDEACWVQELFLSMDHPRVARLLDVYESEGRLSLVMECMEGGLGWSTVFGCIEAPMYWRLFKL